MPTKRLQVDLFNTLTVATVPVAAAGAVVVARLWELERSERILALAAALAAGSIWCMATRWMTRVIFARMNGAEEPWCEKKRGLAIVTSLLFVLVAIIFSMILGVWLTLRLFDLQF